MFLRAGQLADLDARRNEVLGKSASIIQRKVRSYLAHKSFVLLRHSAIQIQASCRGINYKVLHIEILLNIKIKYHRMHIVANYFFFFFFVIVIVRS